MPPHWSRRACRYRVFGKRARVTGPPQPRDRDMHTTRCAPGSGLARSCSQLEQINKENDDLDRSLPSRTRRSAVAFPEWLIIVSRDSPGTDTQSSHSNTIPSKCCTIRVCTMSSASRLRKFRKVPVGGMITQFTSNRILRRP